jgi:DDE superfamily endonuclease
MVKDFDPQTKEKAGGRTRVLLMDGHSSHYSLELLDYAWANNIVILGYPPHCTHVLQGLDVVCFAKMKNEFRSEIQKFEALHRCSVGKGDFVGVFGRAFLRSFTEDAVKAAFAATGVYPFNPDAISDGQMKPSLPTSTKTSFPILQPSPVKAIITAMGSHPPTSFELSPTTHTAPIAGPSRNAPATPSTPTRRYREPTIDPELETPTKRMRILYGALATTSSGSLLVSKVRMTSAFSPITPVLETLPELPVPDWSLLQDLDSKRYQSREVLETHIDELTQSLSDARNIIRVREVIDERKNAQLVLQHSHLGKLNQSLQTKENKTKDDRTKLFPKGHGRHLTAEEFCHEL